LKKWSHAFTIFVLVLCGMALPLTGCKPAVDPNDSIQPVISVSTSELPPAYVGMAYAVQLSAANGNGSYTWSVTSGSLPAGLSLSASGLISGTPTTSGTSAFTVQAAD